MLKKNRFSELLARLKEDVDNFVGYKQNGQYRLVRAVACRLLTTSDALVAIFGWLSRLLECQLFLFTLDRSHLMTALSTGKHDQMFIFSAPHFWRSRYCWYLWLWTFLLPWFPITVGCLRIILVFTLKPRFSGFDETITVPDSRNSGWTFGTYRSMAAASERVKKSALWRVSGLEVSRNKLSCLNDWDDLIFLILFQA